MGEPLDFRTISTAYRFVYSEFPTIFRLSWVPVLIATVINYCLAAAGLVETPAGTPWSLAALGASLLLIAVQSVSWGIVGVAIHRLILFNDRRPGVIAPLRFHRPEILFAAVGFIVALPTLWPHSGAGGVAADTARLLVILAWFYLLVRLSLVYPIVVVENSIRLREGWRLSRRRFWQLLFVGFLGALPAAILFLLAQGIIWHFALGTSWRLVFLAPVHSRLPLKFALRFLFNTVAGGIAVALICFSYKALRGIPPDAIVPQRSPESTNATAAP